MISFPPLLLLFVGTKEPGINLQSALTGEWTVEPFRRLFFKEGGAAERFRQSYLQSVIYATIAASSATILSVTYATWISGWQRDEAVGLSFVLVTLVLLPQTYLIIPALFTVRNIPASPSQETVITVLLALVTLPICAWIFQIIAGEQIRSLHEQCALDGMGITGLLRSILRETRSELAIVFLFGWAIAWGNYLIPFSMGDQESYTVLLVLTTFTSNMGRDWAMISAAGFLVLMPSILVGLFVGFKLHKKSKV